MAIFRFRKRSSQDVEGVEAFELKDSRAPGYYVNNGTDWPDQICGRVPTRDLMAVISRFPAVYELAMDDLARQAADDAKSNGAVAELGRSFKTPEGN